MDVGALHEDAPATSGAASGPSGRPPASGPRHGRRLQRSSTRTVAAAAVRRPYLWACLVALTWATLVARHQLWCCDFDLHLATVRALALDPVHPLDPMIGSHPGSPYFSPYTLALGLVARGTGFAPGAVLSAAGVVNLAVLLVGLGRFCRRLGNGRWLPVLALLALLLLWGRSSPSWSGFPDLTSLAWCLPYPSTLATGLLFVSWDAFLGFRERPSPVRLAAFTLVAVLVVLVHPFTGGEMVLGILAFVAARPRSLRSPVLFGLAAGAAVALGLAKAWPYSDALGLVRASSGLDAAHADLVHHIASQWGLGYYGLALVGLPAVVMRYRRPLGRELAVLFAVAAAVVALAVLREAYALARVIPLVALSPQLSLAAFLAETPIALRRPLTLAYPAAALAALVAGLPAAHNGWRRALPSSATEVAAPGGYGTPTRARDLALLPRTLRPGDVVAAESPALARELTGAGFPQVAPAWPDPLIPDEPARRSASAALFAATTPSAERRRLADAYDVRCVIVRPRSPLVAPGALPGFAVVLTPPDQVVVLCAHS